MIPGHRGPWSAPLCRRLVPAGHSGMGLSPAASGEYGIRLFRVPWPSRPKQISRTTSTGSSDTQSTNGQSTLPHSGLSQEWGLFLRVVLSDWPPEMAWQLLVSRQPPYKFYGGQSKTETVLILIYLIHTSVYMYMCVYTHTYIQSSGWPRTLIYRSGCPGTHRNASASLPSEQWD